LLVLCFGWNHWGHAGHSPLWVPVTALLGSFVAMGFCISFVEKENPPPKTVQLSFSDRLLLMSRR
jgi:hypothetical protein